MTNQERSQSGSPGECIVGNAVTGLLILFASSALAGFVGGTIIPPALVGIALSPFAPSLATMNLLGTVLLDVAVIATVSMSGLLFGRMRQDLTFGQGIGIGAAFLCLPLLLLLHSGNPLGITVIAQAMMFRVVTVLAFLLAATIGALGRDAISRSTVRICVTMITALTALSVSLSPNGGPLRFAPLQPSSGLPRFGEASLAKQALSDGLLPLEESRKHARRTAVLEAAERVRIAPCDPASREGLRAALVDLLNNHIPTWYGPPSETMYARGPVVNVTRQLDGPALGVYRDALTAGIIRSDDLSERAQRELRFTHLGAPTPTLICPGG